MIDDILDHAYYSNDLTRQKLERLKNKNLSDKKKSITIKELRYAKLKDKI